jgi:integrase
MWGIVWGIEWKPLKICGGKVMSILKRHKTNYPGVYYIMGTAVSTGKPERIYYIRYRKDGKPIEEKAGRQFKDDMTASRAANLRVFKIEGKEISNQKKRQAEKARKEADANKWTLERLWKKYKSNNPNLKGIKTYKSQYELWLKPDFADKEPREIVQLDVDRLRLKMLKIREPQTVKHVLSLLNRIVNFGVRKQLCDGLKFSIEMPPVNNIKTEDLNPDQLVSLLESIENDIHPQAGPMMKMALFTGMRRGELFKLKWKDINFDRGFINIIDPKGGPDQKIPLNDATRELLDNHHKTQSPYVFPGRAGRQRVNIAKQVKKIKDDAGIPEDFRPLHGLRHVYASMLASSGEVGMYTLQKLLTHKDPMMTQRYAHLRDYALKNAGNVAGDLINKEIKSIKKGKVLNLKESEK